MTTDHRTPDHRTPDHRPARSALQDDLLADLRLEAPAPAPPAPVPPAPTAVLADPEPGTPTVELRMTPRRWSRPVMQVLGNGFVVQAGPVRLAVTGFSG